MEQILVDTNKLCSALKDHRKKKESPQKRILDARIVERERYINAQFELYPDWKSGAITREEFITMKCALSDKIAKLNLIIADMKADLKSNESKSKANECVQSTGVKSLSRKLLIELIDRIDVYEDYHIRIITKFNAVN